MSKEVQEFRPYEKALKEISGRASMEGDGKGFEIAANVADKILGATDLAGIIAAAEEGPEDLDNWLGKNIWLIPGTLHYNAAAEEYKEGGTGYYTVIDIHDINGERHTVSTGATNIVFQLKAIENQGLLDEGKDPLGPLTIRNRKSQKGHLYWISFP